MVINITSNYPFEGSMESRIGGRAENQDSCGFSDTPSGLLVVICDGMGGGPAGKTASMIAIQTIIGVIKAAPEGNRKGLFQDAISQANAAIIKAAEETPANRGMGTTVIALLINERSAVIAHVGDSRLYKLRDGMKLFRTKDHSMVGEMVRKKILTEEQARLSAQSNIITRALGTSKTVEAEIDEVAFEKGDRFALCSDGIWGAFPEPQLIKKFSSKRLEQTVVEQLAMETDEVGKAKGGHHDNLTVALIKTKTDSKIKDKMTKLAKQIILVLLAFLVICIGGITYLSLGLPEVDELNSQIAQLKEEVSNSNKTIDELNQKIEKKDTELKIASGEIKTLQAQKDAALAQKDAADSKVKLAEKKVKEVEAKIKTTDIKSKTNDGKTSSTTYSKELLKQKLKELKDLTAQDRKTLYDLFKTKKTEILAIISNLSDKVKYIHIENYLKKHKFDTHFMSVPKGLAIGNNEQEKIKEFINNIK